MATKTAMAIAHAMAKAMAMARAMAMATAKAKATARATAMATAASSLLSSSFVRLPLLRSSSSTPVPISPHSCRTILFTINGCPFPPAFVATLLAAPPSYPAKPILNAVAITISPPLWCTI